MKRTSSSTPSSTCMNAKRTRHAIHALEHDQASSNNKLSSLFASNSGFAIELSPEEHADSPPAVEQHSLDELIQNIRKVPFWQSELRSRVAVCLNSIPLVNLAKGDVLYVKWETSTHFSWSCAKICSQNELSDEALSNFSLTGVFHSIWCKDVKLVVPEKTGSTNGRCVELDMTLESIEEAPFYIEPGLNSLVYPIPVSEFMNQFIVDEQKILATHCTGERLRILKKDFLDFDISKLLESAQKIIVWMRDKTANAMQYIEVGDPAVAQSCLKAGHSLYFNPDLEIQRKYLEQIAEDLGLIARGGSSDQIDLSRIGDIEMFAVAGKHKTNWHFDAQENFTIQLSGTKIWHLYPGEKDTIANYHPSSSNAESVKSDRLARHVYSNQMKDMNPTSFDSEKIMSIIMRPGSVLYFPGGTWHQVEAIEDSGSFSMNFSIDSSRWCDLFISQIVPLLWQDSRWRKRIVNFDPVGSRKFLQNLLNSFREKIEPLTAGHFIPNDFSTFISSEEDKETEYCISENRCSPKNIEDNIDSGNGAFFSRNPLFFFAKTNPVELKTIAGEDAYEFMVYSSYSRSSSSGESVDPEYCQSIWISAKLHKIADHLSCLQAHAQVSINELLDLFSDCDGELTRKLVILLTHCGYLYHRSL